ncbi:MAG: DUF5317 domain-containing protein [Anaerolineaceae bacterium]
MILLLAVLFGLAATYLRARLKHRRIRLPTIRWEWLVFAMVLPQVLVFQVPAVARWIPESVIPSVQIISMVGLLVFTAANLRVPGFWALGIGLLSNFSVIAANGGWMPISLTTLKRMYPSIDPDVWIIGARFGLSKDRILAVENTNLAWLSDCFTLPQWVPYKVAFSPGDILISIGVLLLFWSMSRREQEKI